MDVVRLLILELFITNLFCNSGATMAWTFLTMIDTLKAMNSYNWAQGVLDYMHFGLDQAMKNKKDKTNQPSVSGCLVLILPNGCGCTKNHTVGLTRIHALKDGDSHSNLIHPRKGGPSMAVGCANACTEVVDHPLGKFHHASLAFRR
ncbi:stress response protein NST1-like [Prunus yedoensis var. nudiflora]|uniref:Stress response protein NST1-like n=1 Tax=Prunus yedoensis var. nudiflora TaxID=2094558 RepID=A0A314YBM4_PRUYE|nr:stress response protein NST1-like [Prunus yedoensis var. nudiflora]